MQAHRPRFILFADVDDDADGRRWRFALHASETGETVAASDGEPDAGPERLELIALVRGLEALDQPSEVTLVTRNASLVRGVQRGLPEWRNNHWRWERFGRLTPIRNADLWRRIDHALSIHRVRCHTWRIDAGRTVHDEPAAPRPRDGFSGRRFESPAMVIVPAARRRRRVRLSPEPAAAAS